LNEDRCIIKKIVILM